MSHNRDDACEAFVEEVATFGDPAELSDDSLIQAAKDWIRDAREIQSSYDENGYYNGE